MNADKARELLIENGFTFKENKDEVDRYSKELEALNFKGLDQNSYFGFIDGMIEEAIKKKQTFIVIKPSIFKESRDEILMFSQISECIHYLIKNGFNVYQPTYYKPFFLVSWSWA